MTDSRLWFWAAVCLAVMPGWARPTAAQLGGVVPPDRVVTLENDALRMAIAVGPELLVTSLQYKPRSLEFVWPDAPMPLVGIENAWTLNNVGFPLREVETAPDGRSVRIHAYSNYLENPFHLFAELALGDGAELDARVWIENRHEQGYHDLYRSGERTSVIPGLPWLAYLAPEGGGDRTVIYPSEDDYEMAVVPSSRPPEFRPYDAWERPPPPETPVLQFYRNPLLPTIVAFAEAGVTVALDRRASDLNWRFSSVEEALMPASSESIGMRDTVMIFDGTLRFYEGDWHTAFDAFRDSLRADFDFTYYERPGYQAYRNDFLAYHSFMFNHQLYDPVANRYTIEEFLRKAEEEVGGYDQFYFWHAYPRVGVDPRDQFDLFEDLPNGIEGIADLVEKANALSTHVYLAYNPWDRIRERDDMYGEMAGMVGMTGANGVLLDTMGESDLDFRNKVDRYNPDAQFVTEGRPPWSGLAVTTSSWDHPPTSDPMPRVDLLRFVLPEHRAFQIVRWDRDRKPLIYKAFFNATGYVVWEDIFGEINLQSWDEQVLLRRYKRVMQDFARAVNGDRPIPLLPTRHPYLSVNGFFHDDLHLYTLYQQQHESQVHFFDTRVIGPLFEVDVPPDWRLVDVWNMRPVQLRTIDGRQFAYFPYEMPEDLGAIAAMPRAIEVEADEGGWTATVAGRPEGTLTLYGLDQTKRMEPGPEVSAGDPLTFGATSVRPSTDGYVVLQYHDADGELRDVALVKVAYGSDVFE